MSTLVFRDLSPRFLAVAENAVERAVARGTLHVEDEARRITNLAKSPPPSKHPDPPRKMTGRLGASLDSETFRRGRDFIGRVGTNLKYGLYLEIGTRTMQPRPFLRPALDSQRNAIVKDIRRAGREMSRGR